MKPVEYIVFPEVSPIVFRHLQAAEGYLDLELATQAEGELSAVTDAGSMEGIRLMLWGRAHKSQDHMDEAINFLTNALTHHPFQLCADLWRTLGDCYASVGQTEAAENAKHQAEAVANEKSIVAIFTCSNSRGANKTEDRMRRS
ncbi:MAG: tetratricopeptide repeat protein [Planctomycetaceae bacterium]